MAKQTFTTGQVLTAAQVNSLQANDFNQTVSVKTADYTLVAADKGTRIEFNTSGSVTCTVNSGLFDAGDTLIVQNRGAGAVTITAGTATVDTSATLVLSQYDSGTLYFVSASASIFFNSDAAATPLTTKGDLYTFGTSDTRLAVGNNGDTLVADSSTATGLKWATPSSGALTKITAGSFTTVASVDIDDIFSSTYTRYVLHLKVAGSSVGPDLELQFRYAGPATQTSAYYGAGNTLERTDTSINYGYQNTAQAILQNTLTSDDNSNLEIFFDRVGNASETPIFFGMGYGQYDTAFLRFAGFTSQGRTYTGIKIKCSTGTITGTYKVYGLEN